MIIIQIISQKERRSQIFGMAIVILEIISIIVGWLTYKNEFILKSPFCTYYLNGRTICPQFTNGLQNIVQSYEYCYQFSDDCGQAIKIRNIFLAALILPLIFIFYICVLTGCFYWDYFKNKGSLLLSYGFWILCFIICIILFFVDGDKLEELAFDSSFIINLTIRDSSYVLGSLKLVQFLLQIFLFTDLHSQMRVQDNGPQVISPNNQQPYIHYTGPAQQQHTYLNQQPGVPYIGQPNQVQVIQIHNLG